MDLETLGLFALIAVLIYGLVRAADLIEDGFVYLAKSLDINEFFIGFVILSMVSSLPEFSIVLSSNNLIPELSVGNLLGGTLVLITLVMGLAAYKYKGIEFKGRFGEKEVIESIGFIFLGILTLADGILTIVEGIILIIAYLFFILLIYNRYRVKRKTKEKRHLVDSRKVLTMLSRAVAGSLLILLCSSLIVDVIVLLGERIVINEALVGLLVLAIGTSIPEITILARAKKVASRKLAVGNFFGSATINMFILGILAILSQGVDLRGGNNFVILAPVLVILSLSLVAFAYFSWTGQKLTKTEGAMLIGFYISLIITEGLVLAFHL